MICDLITKCPGYMTGTALRGRLSLAAVILGGVFMFAAQAQAQTEEEPPKDIEKTAIEYLRPSLRPLFDLAKWSDSEGLPRRCDEILWLIHKLDPEHKDTKEALGIRVDERGKVVGPRPKRARTKNPGQTLVDKYEGREHAILEGLARTIEKTFSEYGHLTMKRRLEILGQFLNFSPRHGPMRLVAGEKKRGSRWVLAESTNVKRRIKELKQRAKLMLAHVGTPEKVPLTSLESRMRLPFLDPLALPSVRVVGTGQNKEVRDAVLLSAATQSLFRQALYSEARPWDDFTIYMLADRAQYAQFLKVHENFDAKSRDFSSRLTSCWVPRTASTLIRASDPRTRREWVVRQTVAMLLLNEWKIDIKKGAIFEGLGLYLSQLMTGRRSVTFVRQTDYQNEIKSEMSIEALQKKRNWMTTARRRYSRRPPKLRQLLAKDTNQLDAHDLLDSYVLAAYWIEGCPDKAANFLYQIGKGVHHERAAERIWGLSLPELSERVVRWLRERR